MNRRSEAGAETQEVFLVLQCREQEDTILEKGWHVKKVCVDSVGDCSWFATWGSFQVFENVFLTDYLLGKQRKWYENVHRWMHLLSFSEVQEVQPKEADIRYDFMPQRCWGSLKTDFIVKLPKIKDGFNALTRELLDWPEEFNLWISKKLTRLLTWPMKSLQTCLSSVAYQTTLCLTEAPSSLSNSGSD